MSDSDQSTLDSLAENAELSGVVGWVGLTALILAYDIYAIRTRKIGTLTSAAHALGGVSRIGAATVWGVITAHLFIEPVLRKK